jgi:branched-chain amino acid transport system substrate-binding protein
MNSMKRYALISLALLATAGSDLKAEVGVSEKEVVIGQSTALTGASAARPSRQMEGSNVLFDKINKAGGIHGRKIRLISYDDGYDPKKALENAQKLIEQDKVFMFFNFYGTPTIKAMLPMMEKEDVPMLAPSSGASFFREPIIKNMFNVKPGHFNEGETMLEFLIGRSIKDIAIFYQDDSFGGDGRLAVSTAMRDRNIKAVAVGSYKRNETDDVTEAYDIIKKENPKAVVMWSLGKSGINFLKMAKKDNWSPTFVVSSNQLTEELIEASKEFSHPVFVTLNLPPAEKAKLDIAKKYVADTKAAGIAIEPNRFEGYVNAAVLVEALRASGKNLTRDSLRKALESKMTGKMIGGLKCEYSAKSHQAFSKTFVGKIEKGDVTLVTK